MVNRSWACYTLSSSFLVSSFPNRVWERGKTTHPPPHVATMKITTLHALRVRIPQKPPIAPYQSRYRATSAKECILVRLETDNGVVGWGETPEDWLTNTFEGTPEERMRSQVVGRDPFDLDAWY